MNNPKLRKSTIVRFDFSEGCDANLLSTLRKVLSRNKEFAKVLSGISLGWNTLEVLSENFSSDVEHVISIMEIILNSECSSLLDVHSKSQTPGATESEIEVYELCTT